ncbi:MAG: 30S ribosomal protein S14 [Candidatus Walczuchella monophlebidarum]|uniref:30S ribosomal protein S14 n=1 Tax=Candidatus Walczuchella endosymbiont of Icerya purchasi TaxID=3066219 RepID=UPI00313F1733
MAKKSLQSRERNRLKLYNKYAEKRNKLKKSGNYEGLQKLPRNSSRVRLHNRCEFTGRPKGYMRLFGVSRIFFRELVNMGLIPGIKKSSW